MILTTDLQAACKCIIGLGNIEMKVLFKKNIPNALIISIGLHILLLLALGTLYRQRYDWDVKPLTEIEVFNIRSRKSVPIDRRLPRFSFQSSASAENMQQMKTVKVELPSLETSATLVSYPDATIELQIPELASPSRSEARNYEKGLQAKPVGGSETGSVGPGLSSRISGNGKPGGSGRGFLDGTGSELQSDLEGLTLPDLAMTKVGKHIVANRSTDLVDIVFVVDGSGSMKNDIDAVREHLNSMTDLFDSAGMNFTIGVVAFRAGTGYGLLGLDFEVIPQTRSISQVKKILAQLKFRGDENGLDALIRAADEVTFRRAAEIHFIFVTDEYVSGAYSAMDVVMKMKTSRIKVDVIGRDEPFQKFIAKSTGGVWLPISSLTSH